MEHSLYDHIVSTKLFSSPFSFGDLQVSLLRFFFSQTTSDTTISSPAPKAEADHSCGYHLSLSAHDIELVMERLGIHSCSADQGEQIHKDWGYDEMFDLYEQEPSLEQVKEAFDVFDQNRDGFIDAGELQRVLLALGLHPASDLRHCNRMIQVFDQNNDGKIDFSDFVKFMLNSVTN